MSDRGRKFISNHQFLELSDFPDNPGHGTPAFKDGILYIYSQVSGISAWYPLNKPQSSYVHNQGAISLEWEIHHGLQTENINVDTYDATGEMIEGTVRQEYIVDEWVTFIVFTEAVAGYAVLFGEDSISAPTVNAENMIVGNSLTVDGIDVIASLDDRYTKAEITSLHDGIVSDRIYKPAVATFNDLATTYSSAVESWTASVNDTDILYRFDGTDWIVLANGIVPLADTNIPGKLSSLDFDKLQTVEAGATILTTADTIDLGTV